jgi:hypothetical protein
VDRLKQQFSGRQKSRSPEQNTAAKPATSTVNVVTNHMQGDASVISKLSAAVAQQVWKQSACCLRPAVTFFFSVLKHLIADIQ